MVQADKIVYPDGWANQAKQLTLAHTALGSRVVTATVRTSGSRASGRWVRPPILDGHCTNPTHRTEAESDEGELPIDPNSPRSNGEFKRYSAQTSGSKLPADRPAGPLGSWVTAVNQRNAKLEDDLNSTDEDLARLENEVYSLRASLELIVSENKRLSNRLSENDALIAKVGFQLEKMNSLPIGSRIGGGSVAGQTDQMVTESVIGADSTNSEVDRSAINLMAADIEPRTSIAIPATVDEQRQLETSAFLNQLDAMFSRAQAAEKQLAETRQSLTAFRAEHDLMRKENSNLSKRLEESAVALGGTQANFEQAIVAGTAAEAKAGALTKELDGVKVKHATEINTLRARLEDVSLRAFSAETSLSEARKSLFGKFELLQSLLQEKLRQGQELEQSRTMLMKCARVLWQTVQLRDKSLADSELTIKLLTKRICKLIVEADDQIKALPTATLLSGTIAF